MTGPAFSPRRMGAFVRHVLTSDGAGHIALRSFAQITAVHNTETIIQRIGVACANVQRSLYSGFVRTRRLPALGIAVGRAGEDFFGQGVRVVSNIEESQSARNGLDRPGSAYVTGSASVVGCRDTGNVPGGACGRHSGNPSSNQASNREITAPVSCPIATFEPVNLLAIRQEDSLDISWFLWIEPVKGLGLTPTDIGAGGIEKGLDGPT